MFGTDLNFSAKTNPTRYCPVLSKLQVTPPTSTHLLTVSFICFKFPCQKRTPNLPSILLPTFLGFIHPIGLSLEIWLHLMRAGSLIASISFYDSCMPSICLNNVSRNSAMRIRYQLNPMISPTSFETAILVHLSTLQHCRFGICSEMLKSVLGLVTTRTIFPSVLDKSCPFA